MQKAGEERELGREGQRELERLADLELHLQHSDSSSSSSSRSRSNSNRSSKSSSSSVANMRAVELRGVQKK